MLAPVQRLEFGIAQVLELHVHQRGIQVVHERRLESDFRAAVLQRLVHPGFAPARARAVVDARFSLAHHETVPAQRLAHEPGGAKQHAGRRRRSQQLRQLKLQRASQLRRQRFIGIERQNPVVACQAGGEVALRTEAEPRLLDHAGAAGSGNGARVVVAAAVDHDLFGGERHAVEAARDIRRLVVGDDDQADGQCER